VWPGPGTPEDFKPPVYGKPERGEPVPDRIYEIPAVQGYLFSTKGPVINTTLKIVLFGYVLCAVMGYIVYRGYYPYEELRSKEDALIRYHLEDSDDKLLSLIHGEMRPIYYRQEHFPVTEEASRVMYNIEK